MYKKRILFRKFFLSNPSYKIALLLLPLSIILFSSSGILTPLHVSAQQSMNNFLSYNNSTYGIKIAYPGDWKKIEGSASIFGQLPGKNVTGIVGFSPPDNSVFVSVIIEKLAPNMTLSQDVNATISNSRKDMPNYKILESEKATLSGLPAHKLVSEQTISMSNLSKRLGLPNEKIQEIESALQGFGIKPTAKIMYVFAVRDNKEYGVSYGTVTGIVPEDQYSVYLPITQKMIDSFQIMGPSTVTNTPTVKPATNEQNPTCGQFLDTLKTRLVEGNITIQQYGDLRKAIGC